MSQIPWRSLDDLWTNGIYSSNRGHREFKKVPVSFYLFLCQSSSDIIQPIVFGQLLCSITFELNFNYCSFRKAIPLCKNDGIYVRDIQSGAVSSIPHFHRYRVRCIFLKRMILKTILLWPCHTFLQVRAVMGPQSYLLKAYEELWDKELSEEVEDILK